MNKPTSDLQSIYKWEQYNDVVAEKSKVTNSMYSVLCASDHTIYEVWWYEYLKPYRNVL